MQTEAWTYTHLHTYRYACMHTPICACTALTSTYAHIHIQRHNTCICTHRYIHMCTHIYIPTYKHTHIYTCIDVYTHKHTHILQMHIHNHTHTHTHGHRHIYIYIHLHVEAQVDTCACTQTLTCTQVYQQHAGAVGSRGRQHLLPQGPVWVGGAQVGAVAVPAPIGERQEPADAMCHPGAHMALAPVQPVFAQAVRGRKLLDASKGAASLLPAQSIWGN